MWTADFFQTVIVLFNFILISMKQNYWICGFQSILNNILNNLELVHLLLEMKFSLSWLF